MPTSRKLSKERTRARLLQGTLKVLHAEGAAALTTGRIAEAAGVAQPTFYVHFTGIDEALQSAAAMVCDRWQVSLHAARLAVDPAASLESRVHGLLAGYVDVILEDPKSMELFLRHRRDTSSPLGRTFARFAEKLRHDLAEDLGLRSEAQGAAGAIQEDLGFGLMLGMVESILDARTLPSEAVDRTSEYLVRLHPHRIGTHGG